MKRTRWGLLGAGILLDRWMKGFAQVEDAEITAIASHLRRHGGWRTGLALGMRCPMMRF